MGVMALFKEKIGKITEFAQGVFKKDYILGLDIGTSAIKLSQFQRQEDGLYLIKIRVVEITKSKDVIQALREILSGIDIKNSQVITLVNSPQTMVKKIITPQMPQAELKEAISLEAKNYFPFLVSDCLIDFEVIGEVLEKGVKKLELLVAVSPNQVIKEHLNLLNQIGIRPSGVIHPSLALYNLLRLKIVGENLNVAGLDVGKIFCELIIIKDKRLAFSRKIPVCADDFTKAATGILLSDLGKTQLSYEEAEKIKKEYGIPKESGQELIENKISVSQLFSMLRSPAEKLSNEIARSFDFFREETQGSKVDKLVLFGGGSRLKGLDKFLAEELGIGVEIYGSLEGINAKEEVLCRDIEINRIAQAVGAGIDKSSGINLLPPEIKEETKRLVEGATLKAGASAVITLLILTFIGMRIQLAGLGKKIASAELELSALKRQFGEIQILTLINNILKDEPYWEDVLKEISNVIPSNVYLKEMKMQNRLLTIRGIVLSSRNPEEALSRFIHPLERGIFRNVRFITIQDKEGIKEFELQMETE